MLTEIRATAFLGKYRGEEAINRKQIIQTLSGLSRIGVELPEVAEIDINPLLASSDGRLWAVDALVVPGEAPVDQQLPPSIAPDAIGAIFYPKSIAIYRSFGPDGQMGTYAHVRIPSAAGTKETYFWLIRMRIPLPGVKCIDPLQIYRNRLIWPS